MLVIIPPKWNYNIYRKDRSDGYGGVMIAISKVIPSYKIIALQTDCELLWVQVMVGNGNKLFLGARPHVNDQHSIDELNLSLQQQNETAAGAKVWLVGCIMY